MLSEGDVIKTNLLDTADTRQNPFTITRFDLQHVVGVTQPNNYLYTKGDSDIGLRDSDGDGVPNLAYVTGTGAFDKITLDRDATNSNLVHVTVAAYNNAAFTSLIQQETYDINLTTDTEGEILIDSSLSSDQIDIDADIAASVRIRGMLGDDQVKLHGVGASALRKFTFDGEAGNDTFTIDYQNGDPLPLAGFDLNFIGGSGVDNTVVVQASGVPLPAYFVNTFTDGADISVGDGRADSSSATDDQTTLRSAIQEANANFAYVFLPTGTYTLSVAGTGGDAQGDLDITRTMTIIGTGAGQSIISAGGDTGILDRVFEAIGNGQTLTLDRLTVTGGRAPSNLTTGEMHGGGIFVRNGATLNMRNSAVVDNKTTNATEALGGGIFFEELGGHFITNSVITNNYSAYYTGGVFLGGTTSTAFVRVTGSIIAKNSAAISGVDDVGTQPNRSFTSGGNNRLGNAAAGFVNGVNGDYIGSVNYVVTGIADTYDHSNDSVVMSLRDAIDNANMTAGAEEIWLPAWNFVLTRERTNAANATEMEASQGDLDVGIKLGQTVSDASLTVRGVNGATKVGWRPGAVADKVFELLGDYDPNDMIDSRDRYIYSVSLPTQNLVADGDDDGDVDSNDLAVRDANYDNWLWMPGVTVV